MFGLQFPADLAFGPVEVHGDGHVAPVVVLLKQGALLLLHVATENARTGDLNQSATLGTSFYFPGAREVVLPPSPIFFEILKVDSYWLMLS